MRTDILIEIAATTLSLSGAVLNALGHISGFYVWLVANGLWCAFSLRLGKKWMAAMFATYWLLAVVGIWSWSS